MYMESKAGLSDTSAYPEIEDRLSQCMTELKNEVRRRLRGTTVSISQLRAAVSAIAKRYPEFVVWAGEVRGESYVVTIWTNWVGDGDNGEELVTMAIPKDTVIA